jgi:hypothetical protein
VDAEETSRGRSDSAPQAEQAQEVDAVELDTQEALVEAVIPHWRVPHPRIVSGPLTGDRP